MSLTQLIVGKSDTKEIEDWLITIYSPELGKESEVFRLLESKKDGTTVFTPILVDETSDNVLSLAVGGTTHGATPF